MADDLVLAAERIVLGTCMAEPAAVEAVAATLTVASFSDPRHATLFAYLLDAAAAGEPTDPVAIAERLRAGRELTRAGGLTSLHTIYAAALPAANVGHYAGIVAAAAQLREAHVQAVRLTQAVETGDINRVATVRADLVEAWTAQTSTPADSWTPIDLGPYLRGDVERPTPTIGIVRSDGLRLIYRGKEHAVIGEMETGKGWFAAGCVAAELDAGNHVVYVHYEEPDPSDTVERLGILGVREAQIVKLFRFVAPDAAVSPLALARLLEPVPSLVVHDGVNEAMSLHRWGIREEDGAAEFRRHLVAPCLRVGAATLACDHVVKDVERRGRYALGSIHKGNGLSGALVLLENEAPFGRGQRGVSYVFITKDRPGHLRQHGRPTKVAGKSFVGVLVVDDSQALTPDTEVRFWAPAEAGHGKSEDPKEAARREVDERVYAIVTTLAARGEETTLRTIRAGSPYGNEKTADALTRLILDGRLAEKEGPRRSRIFTVTGSGDQL